MRTVLPDFFLKRLLLYLHLLILGDSFFDGFGSQGMKKSTIFHHHPFGEYTPEI